MQSNLFINDKLMDFNTYGTWIGGCGKFFMFSSEKVLNFIPFFEIIKYCNTVTTCNVTASLPNSRKNHFGLSKGIFFIFTLLLTTISRLLQKFTGNIPKS
jgi:hypothetical protein